MVGALPRQAVTALRLLVTAVALAVPGTATATPEAVRPADGETVALGTLELEFVLRDDPDTYEPPVVEISDSPALDEEGHFLEDPVDVVSTSAADTAGTFSGRAEGTWLAQAGTYWWKAYGETCVIDATGDEACEEVSTAARSLQVVARPLALSVTGEAVQPIRADRPLSVDVRCDDACTATATPALWRGTGPERVLTDAVRLDPVVLDLAADRPAPATWQLAAEQVAALRRLEAAGAAVSLVVTVEAESQELVGTADASFSVRLATSVVALQRSLQVKAAGRVRPRSLAAGKARLLRLRWTTWGGTTARGSGVLRYAGGRVSVGVRLTGRRACRGALRYGTVRWRTAGGAWQIARLSGRCR